MEISCICGVSAKSALEHWVPICEQWSKFIESYSKTTFIADTAYNQNERANIGTFASAVWAVGGVALEEFQDIKGSGLSTKNGRVDLWLRSACGLSEYVEAKYLKCSMDGDFISQIENSLHLAKCDALHTKGGSDDIDAVALLFFIPFVKRSTDHCISNEIDSMVERIREQVASDLIAWVFPKCDIQYRHDDGYAVPGVLMIARKY